jgi:hypothetical protein
MEIVRKPELKLRTNRAWKALLSQIGNHSEVVRLAVAVAIELQQQLGMYCLRSLPAVAKAVVLSSTITSGPEQTRSILLVPRTSSDLLEAMYTSGLQQIPFVRLE